VTAIAALPAEQTRTRLLWLDLTRKCQLNCTHCYNASGPDGAHGTMTREDWITVLEQAADCGVRNVQFIGGEPTLHPDFPVLVDHALNIGLDVEVFSNLVHVSAECWALFQRKGLRLATSYYANQPEEHNTVTRRPSHGRTRANIGRAVELGIPLRVGIISKGDERPIDSARSDLEDLGVTRIGVDHVRPFGRGAHNEAPDVANLCGNCGIGTASIGPDGKVSPCVFSGWMGVGNVKAAPLVDILDGAAMSQAAGTIRSATRSRACYPDQAPCQPDQNPPVPCGPDDEGECFPGTPLSTCNPKR
jgi:MoaA/NifB/PqqE/SkfB family radical SAM enzyme